MVLEGRVMVGEIKLGDGGGGEVEGGKFPRFDNVNLSI